MSTPNDNRAGFGVEAKAGSLNQPVKGKIGQPRPAAQPSPSAVEQALAEEQANNEKIGATVQAARASQPEQELIGRYPNSPEHIELLSANQLYHCAVKLEQERDALQAQRDELLADMRKANEALAMYCAGDDEQSTRAALIAAEGITGDAIARANKETRQS